MKILVVDDEPLARSRLVSLIEELDGYEVAGEAANGMEAVSFVEEHQPGVVLMDIRMPGKRGDEIAHRIRQIPAIENIPVVLMTAFVLSDSERFDMISECGVDQIINKPLPDLQQLNKMLHDVISNRTGS